MSDVVEFEIHVDPVSFTFDGPGAIGNPGPPGADSTVPGPQGPVGPAGPKGDPGDDADPAVTDALRTDLDAETARAIDAEATGLAYVRSRGQNLVTNGTGLLGDNANFSTFTYDPADTYVGAGSFRVNVSHEYRFSDELIPVDPNRTYRLTGWAKSGDLNGANYNPANRQYFGVSVYDIDGNPITNVTVTKYATAVDTTLAVALNPGDLTVTLTDGTGWYNGVAFENRTLVWWPYTNNAGYAYPPYTYTRNALISGWDQGGITGNVITLTAPWNGPALPVGTPVRNAYGTTSSNRHTAALNVTVPNTWTRYTGRIGTVDTAGVIDHGKFPPGTAYVRLLFLVNYHSVADNNVRWSGLTFTDAETELAIEKTAAVLAATRLVVGEMVPSDRRLAFGANNVATLTNGKMLLHYFTAERTEQVTAVETYVGPTVAAATPTLVRVGIYEIAANGNGTLVAATANDTTMYATANAAYLRSLTSTFSKVDGQRYAVGCLCVTAATAPVLMSVATGTSALADVQLARDPRVAGAISGLTDLPPSFTAATVTSSRLLPAARLA